MRAGRLNRRVTVQRSTPTQNSYGEEIESWANLATRWASIMPVKGAEQFSSSSEKYKQPYSIMVRYGDDLSDLTTEDRILFGSRVFDIESIVNNHEENISIELLCVERSD